MGLKIKWNPRALAQFDEAIKYIEQTSLKGAEKVKYSILVEIDALTRNPEKHKPDKFKTRNDGSFRAFELHRYRVSYRYNGNEIRIIRVRHVKMSPLEY
jgi:plasmid stabilization system protein ParE